MSGGSVRTWSRRNLLASITAAPSLAQYIESERGDVPWVPTPDEVITTMLEAARVTRDDTVFDLGCGDGRIVIEAARRYGARGVGIDIEPDRIAEAHEAAREAGVTDRVRFLEQNLFHADISQATVVTLYLFTAVNARLKPMLRRDLCSGARVVAYQFNGMGDWKPRRVIRRHSHPVYLWVLR